MQQIKLKRAYDPVEASDGYRVYVDKLYPRGLSKDKFIYDEWVKGIAPSTQLREWFHQDPENRWPEFETKYREELEANPAFAAFKKQVADKPTVTLLFSSRDREHNNADVVEEELESK